MSVAVKTKRVSTTDIKARKGGEKIVSLTAYTAPMAKLVAPHVDFMLVGDSLAMVIYGMTTTVGVTLDMMIAHGIAARRGAPNSCIVVDMPFGSYEESKEQAFRNAARVMTETGCDAVKMEGGTVMADTIHFLANRGIPVMAHVGLLPQSVNTAGGYRSHGRTPEEAAQILADAKAVAEAGAFAVVIEGVVEPLGREITAAVDIPTIGIGASPECDGQILVLDDVLGLYGEFQPRFAKRYADLDQQASRAIEAYANEVRLGTFPTLEHCFGVDKKLKAM
ncbi:MAG: 3-methyl-2-oxobutanoate hydroxymethyltransferase [Magnetospiraceae bacterium]